jgi:hypothetical protein
MSAIAEIIGQEECFKFLEAITTEDFDYQIFSENCKWFIELIDKLNAKQKQTDSFNNLSKAFKLQQNVEQALSEAQSLIQPGRDWIDFVISAMSKALDIQKFAIQQLQHQFQQIVPILQKEVTSVEL